MMKLSLQQTPVRAWWSGLAARERALIAAGAALIVLAVLWALAVAPALTLWRGAEAQHQKLDAELAQVLALQTQAQALQQQPRASASEVQRAVLQLMREQLGGGASLVQQGERLSITITGASPEGLAQLLAQLRQTARALPSEAKLTRNNIGQWEGTIALPLPAP